MAVPVSPGQEALSHDAMDTSGNPDAFRDATVDYFARGGAEFEIRVQLCTDLDAMPVEDASVQWPEDRSPYRPVARLVLPKQDAMSEARSAFVTDSMSFRPGGASAAGLADAGEARRLSGPGGLPRAAERRAAGGARDAGPDPRLRVCE